MPSGVNKRRPRNRQWQYQATKKGKLEGRRTHGHGGRYDLLPVFDDDADVRVLLGDEDGLRADPPADVDEHRAFR